MEQKAILNTNKSKYFVIECSNTECKMLGIRMINSDGFKGIYYFCVHCGKKQLLQKRNESYHNCTIYGPFQDSQIAAKAIVEIKSKLTGKDNTDFRGANDIQTKQ